MRLWKTILKRGALALVAASLAFTWTQTGHAQAPCLIERGQDPLDVLNFGVRHNVWIVLDTSGSMGDRPAAFGGDTKMEVAQRVLTEVIDEFVDASGKPLVNWGYVEYARNSVDSTAACNAQFTGNRCVGLNLGELINPPSCDDPVNTGDIKTQLNQASPSGSTPNGISMDQISDAIVNNGYVSGLLPNQKNFVILVTDGDDTCECGLDNRNQAGKLVNGVWTPTPTPPFLGANAIPRSLRGSAADWSYTLTAGTNSARIRAVNAGTKGRLAYERLNPTAADRSTGALGGAFVIGLGLTGDSPSLAHHIAWESSGAYYGNPEANPALLANDPVGLKQALFDAFAKIGVPQSTVTLGSPTVGTVREVIPTYTNIYVAPDQHVGDVGPGPVDPDDIQEARKVRANHTNNVVFQTAVDIPDFRGHFEAFNLYSVTDPSNPRTARTADFTKIWDAGERLQQTDPANRNLLFNRRGSTALLPFDSANVTAADLGVSAGYLDALTDNDARDMVIGVVRGYRLSRHASTGTHYKPDGTLNFSTLDENGDNTWKLYDAIAAPAIVSSPPRSPDFDPPQNHSQDYGVGGTQVGDGFFWDHFNRQTMVYLPTNGGVMHAFDAETGDEVFGYIPDDSMSLAPGETPGSRDTLKDFVALVVDENNGIANHQYLLSGSPTVDDAFLRSDRSGGDDDWHTLLAFGRGRGGRFVSILDITDPNYPKLQFNRGNREGLNDGLYDGLGETWSQPVIGNVQVDISLSNPDRVDQWVVFFGAGYGCDNAADEGHYLYAARVEDGDVYHRAQVSNDGSAIIDHNAVVAMPRLYNPHEIDVADKKDYITRVYVGDVQGNIWKLVTTDIDPANWTFQKFAEMGDDQPITAPVAILKDTYNQQIWVMAGTGGDLRVSSAGTTFKFATFLDQDAEGANTTQYPNGTAAFWEKPLFPDERVYVAPVTIGSMGDATPPLVFFAASTPAFSPATCTGKFLSSLWALGIMSGQAEVDLDGGGNDERLDLGESKVTGLYARGGNLYVSQSGGLGTSGKLSVFGDGRLRRGASDER